MRLSAKAEGLLADLARQQGLKVLTFDSAGLIPIRFDDGTEIAIGYSPANDALLLIGVVDASPDWTKHRPWTLFERNVELSKRRTRLALTAEDAMVLTRDAYVEGIDYQQLEGMLETFVRDLDAQRSTFGMEPKQSASVPANELDVFHAQDFMIIRP